MYLGLSIDQSFLRMDWDQLKYKINQAWLEINEAELNLIDSHAWN